MQQPNLTRVVVIGTSGSGKTTFARRLASRLGTRSVELDALYWGPRWTPRTDFELQVRLAVQEPQWVIDGNYSSVRDMIWARSTAIVWLDYSFARIFSQAFRRTARRVLFAQPLYADNRETIRATLFDMDAPLWLVVRTYKRRRREFPTLFEQPQYRHADIVRLQAPAAADTFIAGLLPVD